LIKQSVQKIYTVQCGVIPQKDVFLFFCRNELLENSEVIAHIDRAGKMICQVSKASEYV